uniref:Uncharacterized protein n=1 Tax=Magallana gigas TaxID=29159 RepID=K1R879_MAGGI
MNENGCIPRTHKNKNRRPSNAFCFDDLKNAIDFIQNYAEEFGLPQPNVKNQGNPHIFLQSSGNKSSLHSTYVTSCTEANKRHVGLTTFKLLWRDCCPHIKYMTPRSDICPKCENHRANISTAAGQQEKQEHLQAFTEHLLMVEKERQLSMQVSYHGRCLVDAGFANIKRLYHRTDVDSLSGLVEVVRKSARSNSPVTYTNDAGEHSWEWYDWKSFTSTFFTNVKGIRKMLHFRFPSLSPGKLFVKSHADDSEREITLLKSSISPEDITTGSVMPDILPPGGMTSERQRYLFRVVRPFVRDPFKDTTCPEAEE